MTSYGELVKVCIILYIHLQDHFIFEIHLLSIFEGVPNSHIFFCQQPTRSRRSDRNDSDFPFGTQGSGEYELPTTDRSWAKRYDVRKQDSFTQWRLLAGELLFGVS